MAYTTAQLTGTYKTFDDQPASGVVEIIPNSRSLVDAEGDVILAGRVKVTLDEAGSFSVTLPATDDATVEPATGRQYTVVAKLRHTHLPAVTGVELATGATVDVADVASAPVVDPAVSLAATTAQLDALEADVTTALAGKQDAGDYATTAALTTGLAGKADAADLAPVATTGAYTDLTGQPAIPAAPEDVGAEPAGLSAATEAALSATFGKKNEYVVKPDGTGDYATLAAAVAAVTSGTIRLTDGTHTVSGFARLNPAAGVRVVGNGHNTVVRLANGTDAAVFSIANNNVTIENLRVDGNKANQTPTSSNGVIFGTGVVGGALRGCWVHDAAGYGIVAWDNASNIIIEGNFSYNHQKEGIELHGAHHCVIADNIVYDVGVNGIYLWNAGGDCGYNTVTGNLVHGCAYGGIVLQDGAHDTTISGNTVEGCNDGIQADAGSTGVLPHSLTIAGNTTVGNVNRGLSFDSILRLVLTGNVVRANGSDGVLVTNSSNLAAKAVVGAVVTDNVVYGNGQWGMLLTVQKSSIAANTIGHNQREGIRLIGNYNTLTGNVIYNNSQVGAGAYDGLRLGGGGGVATYTSVTGNVVRDDQTPATQRLGINEDSTSSGPNVIVGNVSKGSGSGQLTTRHASSIAANNLTA